MSDVNDGPGGNLSPFGEEEEPEALGAAATLPVGKKAPRGKGRGKGAVSGAATAAKGRLPRVGLGTGSIIIVLALIAVAVVPTVMSALKKTPRDRVGISYGGGPFEGAHFQRIVAPGSKLFFNGWFDPLYLYPADQQNYIISKTFGQGQVKQPDSVIAPTKDRVQVEYQVAAFFKLNIDRLRAFHEQLGLKYSAYTAAGWNNMLQDTFRQQIESSLQQETRRYTVEELVGSADVLVNIQRQVQATITSELRTALGQQFFCGPTYVPKGNCGPITFVIKKVDIPTAVQSAFNAVAQRTYEAQSIDIFASALKNAGPDYVLLRAIESGAISFWVIPNGTDLTLQAPGANGLPGSSGALGGSTGTTTTTSPASAGTAGSTPTTAAAQTNGQSTGQSNAPAATATNGQTTGQSTGTSTSGTATTTTVIGP